MLRSCLAAAIALGLTAGALAVDDSPQLHREYTDRLLTMDDTAAAHVALAQWCRDAGLPDKAWTHWQQALVRDADNREARAALGYVRRGAGWVRTEAGAASPPAATAAAPALAQAPAAADPAFGARRRELTQTVRDIARDYLGTADPGRVAEGRARLLALHDPAAAEPLARILGTGNADMRILACEALAGVPGDEASRYLVRFVLADESRPVYEAAVAALAARQDERGLVPLTNALNGSEKVLKRAAYALGEMREPRAVPALVNRLRTQESRVKTYDAPRGSRARSSGGTGGYLFSGTVITYIRDVEPVVAEAAVGWNPTIGAIPVGAVISVSNPSVRIHRTIIEFVRQPVVLEALKKITGKDFGYDTPAWRDWIEGREPDPADAP